MRFPGMLESKISIIHKVAAELGKRRDSSKLLRFFQLFLIFSPIHVAVAAAVHQELREAQEDLEYFLARISKYVV